MKKILYIASFSFFFSISTNSFAGFGDNTSTNEEEEPVESVEKKSTNDFDTEGKFSKESFSSNEIMDADDDPPPVPEIPLDGGASLLLLGGIGLGIKKLFGKRKPCISVKE